EFGRRRRMLALPVTLIDADRRVIATAQVAKEEGRYCGTIDLRPMPQETRRLFDEFEEIVNGQMFSFLDDIEDRISDLSLRVVFGDGAEAPINAVQIYPGGGRISFRLAKNATPSAVAGQ